MALGRDGLPKKRVWYFDPADPEAAVRIVADLKSWWRTLRKAGKVVWDEDPDYVADRATTSPVTGSGAAKPVTVGDAARLYCEQLRQQMEAGQIAASHNDSQRHRLTTGLQPLSLTAFRRRRTAAAGGRAATRATSVVELYRPPKRTRPIEGSSPVRLKSRRMSAVYARATISTA